jgi:hypothetical protein
MVEERRREAAAELPLCAAALSQQPLPLRARLPSTFCDWPGFVCRVGYVMWFMGITCIIYIMLCIDLALSVCVSRRCVSSLHLVAISGVSASTDTGTSAPCPPSPPPAPPSAAASRPCPASCCPANMPPGR